MAARQFSPRMLIVSLGNPAPLHETRHSAGHLVLSALQMMLSPTQPPFLPGRRSALASVGPKYTLVQCPTLMNVSGKFIAKTYDEALAREALSSDELALVLVHDDLELKLGDVKRRDWDSSHKGHNGIKSAQACLRAQRRRLGDDSSFLWSRLSVGIGRPEARDHDTVSSYVLEGFPPSERAVIEDDAPLGVMQRLRECEATWKRRWEAESP